MPRSRSRSRSSDAASGSDSDYYEDSQSEAGEAASDREDGELAEQGSASQDNEDGLIDISKVVLCSLHKAGQMTMDCSTCSGALKLIKGDKVVKQLLAAEPESEQTGLESRYDGRCDDTVTTLQLSAAMVKVASKMFHKGTFKDVKTWREIVKKYLHLPLADHEVLSGDLENEDFIQKFKKENRFKHVIKFSEEMLATLKNLRVAQRPIFAFIDAMNKEMTEVKSLASRAGLQYPTVAPPRSEDTVPRNGRVVLNDLKTSSVDRLLPRPDMSAFITKAGLSEELAVELVNIMDSYRVKAADEYMDLYNVVAAGLIKGDDLMIFYMDLYSHVDSSLRDLVRNKISSLFKSDVKDDLLRQSSSHRMKGEKAKGLFGGDAKIKAVLKDASKTKEIMNKAAAPRREYQRSHDDDKDGRYRDRSRSPPRDRNSYSYGGRSRQKRDRSRDAGANKSNRRKRHGGGGGGEESSMMKSKKSKDKEKE